MICKTCKNPYTANSAHEFEAAPHLGWHPNYGNCYLCFLFAMFGGYLEPTVRHDGEPEDYFYQITPLDTPSRHQARTE